MWAFLFSLVFLHPFYSGDGGMLGHPGVGVFVFINIHDPFPILGGHKRLYLLCNQKAQ